MPNGAPNQETRLVPEVAVVEQPNLVPIEARSDRLNSWKDIAVYLNRDVRTVRRWEKDQGLPVHRHQHKRGASVYASRAELDSWWKGGKERLEATPEAGVETDEAPALPLTSDSPLSERRNRTGIKVAVLILVAVGLGWLGHWMAARYRVRPGVGKIVLAVLPFDDMSGEPQEYLSDGLTEEMIEKATHINPQQVRVIARTSAMQYRHTHKTAKEIGQELGADYILENSIRHEGTRLRITTQLVRTSDQTHIWATDYDRDMRALLSMEGDVTVEIAAQLRSQLTPTVAVSALAPARAVNPEAHQFYLQGRYYFSQRTRESLFTSVDFLQKAVAKDPTYAAAYAGLADSYNLIGFFGFDRSLGVVSQAKIAADKALQLDPTAAAAHAALAYSEFMWRGDWQTAEAEFRRAVELDDNYVQAHQWFALYLAAAGKTDESLNQMKYALRLDPLSPSAHAGLAYVSYFARDYQLASQEAQVALKLNPNFMVAHAVLGWTYTQQQRFPEAIEELRIASRLSGNVPVYQCALGRAYALSGNTSEARKLLDEERRATSAEPRGSGSALAALYVALGDSGMALKWLELSASGDIQINWLRVDPAFDGLRANPRFSQIVNRVGKKNPE